MQIFQEKVEGDYYIDITLTDEELKNIRNREMIQGSTLIKKDRYYLGIFLQGQWSYEEEI